MRPTLDSPSSPHTKRCAHAVIGALAMTLGLLGAPAKAEVVDVTITGSVVFNGIGAPPLNAVGSGDAVTLSFSVDSSVFVDGIPGDLRSYEIDPSSFAMAFDTPVTIGLLNPLPGVTPYFTLIDGFPVSDGFFVSTSTMSPGGVPLEQEPFEANLQLGYQGDTLDSLDILAALGIYDFGGLTSFGFNLWSIFPDNVAMEIDFAQMEIASVIIPVELIEFGVE